MTLVWRIESLPFVFRALDTPHNPPPIPDTLPFQLGVEATTGRLLQVDDAALHSVLSRAYSDGTMITGTMDETGIGRQYTDDFLSLIATVLGRERLDGLRILELGSGTGYLMHRMAALGAAVVGVEPGPQAELAARQYGLDVRRGYFPNVDVGEGYDVAVMYLLLEHVADPTILLRDVARVVRPGGTVIVAVQNEEPYIRSGEVSLLFHEHYSYFTASTLERTIATVGGSSIRVEPSGFSNILFGSYVSGALDGVTDTSTADVALAHDFRRRAERVISAVWAAIDAVRNRDGTIGLYVPGRAVNILSMRDDTLERVRFFDDNPLLRDTFYPGIPIAVEGRDRLLADPPSSILIMSLSFGEAIAESIRGGLPRSTDLVPLSAILSH